MSKESWSEKRENEDEPIGFEDMTESLAFMDGN